MERISSVIGVGLAGSILFYVVNLLFGGNGESAFQASFVGFWIFALISYFFVSKNKEDYSDTSARDFDSSSAGSSPQLAKIDAIVEGPRDKAKQNGDLQHIEYCITGKYYKNIDRLLKQETPDCYKCAKDLLERTRKFMRGKGFFVDTDTLKAQMIFDIYLLSYLVSIQAFQFKKAERPLHIWISAVPSNADYEQKLQMDGIQATYKGYVYDKSYVYYYLSVFSYAHPEYVMQYNFLDMLIEGLPHIATFDEQARKEGMRAMSALRR